MKTKIAVTDACIFIDLYDLGLASMFFNLDVEIHTTSSVYFDLKEEHRQVLNAYQSVKKLIVHNLAENDFIVIHSEPYPNSLSETDKSVIYIANNLNASVLSSNKVVIDCAINKAIKIHGMIWIFDNLVYSKTLSRHEASIKLKQLVTMNFVFQNNQTLKDEIKRRFNLWE
ncbi:hypothetical protein [Sunxiuqinia indica]|uniref:hypothetical protein n=1 Tax=Sunxiuqinia indica TaxID=2692584 RepID=UPI001356B0CD|nr:hypothetical protein [Sunxiuqinia indica]